MLKVGDIVYTQYGHGILLDVRDGVCHVQLNYGQLYAPRSALCLASQTTLLQPGDTIPTPYGVGRVVEIREHDDMCVLDLSFGRLYAPTTTLRHDLHSHPTALPPPTHPTPLDVVRKAGVAVTGGTMVVVGAIMTPLPTPFGAVIAASGLAVLGTEFDQAKQVNDKLVAKTRPYLEMARDKFLSAFDDNKIAEENSVDDVPQSDDLPPHSNQTPEPTVGSLVQERRLSEAMEKLRRQAALGS